MERNKAKQLPYVLFSWNNKKDIRQAYISKHNSGRENQVILLMIMKVKACVDYHMKLRHSIMMTAIIWIVSIHMNYDYWHVQGRENSVHTRVMRLSCTWSSIKEKEILCT